MLFNTKHFGEIEVDAKDIYIFPEGLPGFEDKRRFVLIKNPSEDLPFSWLQSIEDKNLAFALIDPFFIIDDYEADIQDDEVAFLEIEDVNEVLLLSVVVVPENIKKISANLLAPVLFNTRKNIGKQITLNSSKYSIRHYIFEHLNNNGGVADAGTDKKEK